MCGFLLARLCTHLSGRSRLLAATPLSMLPMQINSMRVAEKPADVALDAQAATSVSTVASGVIASHLLVD